MLPNSDSRVASELIRVLSLLLLASLVAGLFSGCSLLRYRTAEPPRVTVTGVQLAGMSLFEQKFDVGLRLQNPNDFALPITGMEYKLYIDDEAVASGVSNAGVDLAAFGEEVVTVSVIGNLLASLAQLRRWQESESDGLEYRVDGRLKMADVAVKIPFTHRGKFDLKLK